MPWGEGKFHWEKAEVTKQSQCWFCGKRLRSVEGGFSGRKRNVNGEDVYMHAPCAERHDAVPHTPKLW